jgi:hypothetical protein
MSMFRVACNWCFMYHMSHVATILSMKTSPHVSPHLMMWHVVVTDVADSCYMSAIEHPHHSLVCDRAKTFLTSEFSYLFFW